MTKKTDIWLPVYCGDYLKDTQDLTLTEHGAFFRLMMAYWQLGPLDQTNGKCFRIAGAYTQEEQQAVQTIIDRFFYVEDGLIRNKRLDAEKIRSIEFKNKQAANGRLGGRPPKNNPDNNPKETQAFCLDNPNGNPNHNPNESPSPSPSPSPLPSPSPSLLSGRKRPSRQRPVDWEPNENHQQLAKQLGLLINQQADKFRDWHDQKGSVFADWDAAFRTWLRKSVEMNAKKPERHNNFAQRDYTAGVTEDGKF